MLALPVAVLLQGLEGHSSLVNEVCRDFHTSISKWEDKVMSYSMYKHVYNSINPTTILLMCYIFGIADLTFSKEELVIHLL